MSDEGETWWELCEHCWGKGMDPDDPGGCARCPHCDGAGEVECSDIDWGDDEDEVPWGEPGGEG